MGEIHQVMCSTFLGEFMSQFRVWAMICVRKAIIGPSIQAQYAGDFMIQKWRSYAIFDNYVGESKRILSVKKRPALAL